MNYDFPYARPGQTIGLLGGSFDPPHAGHVLITQEALKRFGLDRVWWLVSPGNPLKAHGPAPMDERLAAGRELMQHSRVTITGIEESLGTRYTAQTLRAMQRRYRGVRFVWLMGADNLAQLHHWKDWQWIMQTVPVGVLARPGSRINARLSRAARAYADARLPGKASRLLARSTAPRWCFVNIPMVPLSSSAIRAQRGK
jgi:nicotinate-nucleotide adenylyltransferase